MGNVHHPVCGQTSGKNAACQEVAPIHLLKRCCNLWSRTRDVLPFVNTLGGTCGLIAVFQKSPSLLELSISIIEEKLHTRGFL